MIAAFFPSSVMVAGLPEAAWSCPNPDVNYRQGPGASVSWGCHWVGVAWNQKLRFLVRLARPWWLAASWAKAPFGRRGWLTRRCHSPKIRLPPPLADPPRRHLEHTVVLSGIAL